MIRKKYLPKVLHYCVTVTLLTATTYAAGTYFNVSYLNDNSLIFGLFGERCWAVLKCVWRDMNGISRR